MMEQILPAAFSDLAPFLEWSLPDELARSAKRQASSMVEISAFYHAMLPRLESILGFLAEYPPSTEIPQVRHLANLAFALAEVAPAVENYGQPSVVDGYDVKRFMPVYD